MKFCQFCGRSLQDNEVCNCQAQRQQGNDDLHTVQAGQPTYPQQPAAPQPQPYMNQPQQYSAAPQQYSAAPQQYPAAPQQYPAAPQQPYYGQPVQKAEGKFSKTLKKVPDVLKNYWTDNGKSIDDAKKDKDVILPLLFIIPFFIVNLILGICYFARMTDITGGYANGLGMFKYVFASSGLGFQFGYVLLTALIMTAFSLFIYVLFRSLASMILAKKKPDQAIIDALIEFGINTMPICLWLVLGSLLTLATCWLTVPFIGMAMSYYVIIGVSNTIKECGETKNVFVRNVILAAFVMLTVGLTTWMFYLCCQMNVGISYYLV